MLTPDNTCKHTHTHVRTCALALTSPEVGNFRPLHVHYLVWPLTPYSRPFAWPELFYSCDVTCQWLCWQSCFFLGFFAGKANKSIAVHAGILYFLLGLENDKKKEQLLHSYYKLLITCEINNGVGCRINMVGFPPFETACLTIFFQILPCCLLCGRPPPVAARARENAYCLPAFVPARLQWGWAVCSLGQGLQIMTHRGLVDLWSLWPISQRSLIPPPIGPCEVCLTLWPPRKRQRKKKKKKEQIKWAGEGCG